MTSTSSSIRFGVNAGKAIKVPCKAASTGNLTLSGLQTIDGVNCVADDRVLVKDQSDGTENGIYRVSTGTWSRSPDWNDINDVTRGTLIYVSQGTTNGNTLWRVSTTGTITPGTTAVSFLSFALDDATNVAYTAPVTGGTERDLDDRLGDFLTVFDFGAVGNGVTDDGGAFQDAADWANSVGHGTIYVPATATGYAWSTAVDMSGMEGVSFIGVGTKYGAPVITWTGSGGATMLTMEGTRYCTLKNLNFDCDSSANIAINHYWDGTGSSSYESIFEGVFVQNAVATGIIIGNANNYQTSEVSLYDVIVTGCATGVSLLGQNTINIRTIGLKLESNATGLYIDGASGTFVDTLWNTNSTRDLYINNNQSPLAFVGGYSENSEKFVFFPASGASLNISFQSLSISADSSGAQNLMCQDSSLFNVTWFNCTFKEDCGCHVAGFAPIVENYGLKKFINCTWTTGSGVGQTQTNPIITTNNPMQNCIVEVDSNHTLAQTFIDGDATPSVLKGRVWNTANTNPTTISSLDDGGYGADVFIMIGDNNTTVEFRTSTSGSSATLTGNDGSNWSPVNGDAMRCVKGSTYWRCQITSCTT